jgi:hypothetical protein
VKKTSFLEYRQSVSSIITEEEAKSII